MFPLRPIQATPRNPHILPCTELLICLYKPIYPHVSDKKLTGVSFPHGGEGNLSSNVYIPLFLKPKTLDKSEKFMV